MTYHLAHINVARARVPLKHPVMNDFFDNVARVNAAAEAAPGFVWRLVDESTDPTRAAAFPEARQLVALSVWTNLDAIRTYVYKMVHVDFMRRRREWFERAQGPNLALWWIPEGHRPTLGEARQRLDHLEAHGATPFAFTFGAPFDEAGTPH